jgi:glutamine amidotransferase
MIVVVDYKAGNLYNVGNALHFLQVEYQFSSDPEVISRAEKVILPGVGSARAAMDSLKQQGLAEVIRTLKVPFLGICLGLQLLFEVSEEDNTECLGVFPGSIRKFNRKNVKVPHIGWNRVHWSDQVRKWFPNLSLEEFFYFVHSYYAPIDTKNTIGTTCYDLEFSSAVQFDNFFGFQFHPERSGEVGLRLLNDFVQLKRF